MNIPNNIFNAVNGLLQPYGVNLAELLSGKSDRDSLKPDRAKTLTVSEAVAYSGLSKWTLWRRIKSGELKATKMHNSRQGRVLVSLESLDALLEDNDAAIYYNRNLGGKEVK